MRREEIALYHFPAVYPITRVSCVKCGKVADPKKLPGLYDGRDGIE